jgi:hypothetical protein
MSGKIIAVLVGVLLAEAIGLTSISFGIIP